MHNGETTYFWSTNWSPYGKLSDYLRTSTSSRYPIRKEATLAELWENDVWILPNASSDRHLEFITYISSLALDDCCDEFEWWPEIRGTLVVAQVQCTIYYDQRPRLPCHKEVWFSGGIPKHMFLVWLMVRNRCPTRDRILSWGLQTDPSCLFRNAANESIAHCFFECRFTWEIWKVMAAKCGLASSRQWEAILIQLRGHSSNKVHKTLLLLCWQATLYTLWMERNRRLRNSNFSAVETLVAQIKLTIKNMILNLRTDRSKFSSSLIQLWFST